jgi:hypothetical protein
MSIKLVELIPHIEYQYNVFYDPYMFIQVSILVCTNCNQNRVYHKCIQKRL